MSSTAEIEFLAQDGRRIPLDLQLCAIERDGEIVGLQGIARDITRRKAMEARVRHLAEQEHRRAEQLQTVARVGRKIARLTSLQELLPNVANLMHQLLGYERVAIFLLDPERKLASLGAAAGRFAAPVPQSHDVAENEGIIGWVAAHGQMLHVQDVRLDPRYVARRATVDTLSELAVPIRTGGQLLGVLDVESTRVNAFDANDEATITIMSRQIATTSMTK